MSHLAERYEHEGVSVAIYFDEIGAEHADPRDNDNLATMICWHPDYVLGDEQFQNPDGRGALSRDHHGSADNSLGTFRSMEHLRRYIGIVREGVCILPLFLLDHSGISIHAGAPSPFDPGGWDTTHVGYIYTTHERITELCGEEEKYHADEWIEEQVRGDVDEYNLWLTGQCFVFVVGEDSEEEDACGGYLGMETVREAANEAAKDIARERYLEHEPPDMAEVLSMIAA